MQGTHVKFKSTAIFKSGALGGANMIAFMSRYKGSAVVISEHEPFVSERSTQAIA
jgi:hypothetical protein